jgi:putative oxidoreductase
VILDVLASGGWNDAILFVARLCLAAMFVVSARDKFRGDMAEIAMIKGLGLPAPERLERLAGLCELAGALMLAAGLGARIAALLLAAFLMFLTLAFLRYWSFGGPSEAKQAMRNAFFGNGAAVGGLLILAVTGPGGWALMPAI